MYVSVAKSYEVRLGNEPKEPACDDCSMYMQVKGYGRNIESCSHVQRWRESGEKYQQQYSRHDLEKPAPTQALCGYVLVARSANFRRFSRHIRTPPSNFFYEKLPLCLHVRFVSPAVCQRNLAQISAGGHFLTLPTNRFLLRDAADKTSGLLIQIMKYVARHPSLVLIGRAEFSNHQVARKDPSGTRWWFHVFLVSEFLVAKFVLNIRKFDRLHLMAVSF
jgi:hypothetical protein